MPHPTFNSDDARWNAVRRKDILADGVFVCCVRTTKIYCRPVCKARLARRDNVEFHSTPDEAERAGYRPCKRCKPHLVGRMPENSAVRRVRAMVERQELSPLAVAEDSGGQQLLPLPPPPPVADLACLERMAKQAGLSKWHFHRIFKEVTNMTPMKYVRHQQSGSSTPVSVGNSEEMWTPPEASGTTESTVTSRQGSLAVDTIEADLIAPIDRTIYGEELSQPHIEIPTLDDWYFDFEGFIKDLDCGFYGSLACMPEED
ncbi:DNA repair and transcription factor Ada [Apiospora arundinis]